MKQKTQQTEQEKYFARKNQRRQWWCENGHKFFLYPFYGAVIAVSVVLAWTILSMAMFHTAVWCIKQDHLYPNAIYDDVLGHDAKPVVQPIHITFGDFSETPSTKLIYFTNTFTWTNSAAWTNR